MPITASRNSLLPLLLLLAAAGAAPLRAAAPLAVLRSDRAALPESIRRETLASVDRACDALRDGRAPGEPLWSRPDSAPDPRPAAALCEAGWADPALAAALAAVEASLTKPWGPRDVSDAALVLLGAAWAGTNPPAPVLRRLERARLDAVPAADAAFALTALDAFGADTAAGWDRLAERPVPAAPTLSDVAAAALARQARASRRSASDDPSPDVLAHVRWLAARLRLGFRASGARPDPAHPVDPENALLVTLAASSLPRRALADPRSGLLPYDWRNHLADRLLALQLDDPPGHYHWAAADGDERRATVLAVLALRILAAE